ncbi:MAG: hypothetical protein RDU25_00065 [Patescibacteria group bacterium]|nr:hypothetical protein [Patescibacteria group bacterium]
MTIPIVYVPAPAVFPELTQGFDSFCSLVRSLSRTDVLFWCARINLLLSNPNAATRIDVQRWGLAKFFGYDEIQRVERFAQERGGADKVMVFSRAQLLELFRWSCLLAEDNDDDGTTFENPEVRRRFAQAALMASGVWSDRVYANGLPASDDRGADRRTASPTIRRAVADNLHGLDLQRALARGSSIYDKHIRLHDPGFHDDFKQTTGLGLDRYPLSLCGLMVDFCNVTLENVDKQPGIFNPSSLMPATNPGALDAVARFVELESRTPDELRAALMPGGRIPDPLKRFDDKPLREKPVLRTPDGRAIIIDPRFFSEKAVVGPLFHLAKAHGKERARVNGIFAAFGSSFEGYAKDLLAKIGSRGNALWLNPKRKTSDGDVEMGDAALRFGADLLLVEAKGVFVRDDSLQSGNANPYLCELRRKYSEVTDGDRGARRPKGVGQLARAIRQVIENSSLQTEKDVEQVVTIFPVLVVFDSLLQTPGHLEFLDVEFSNALGLCSEPTAGSHVLHGRFLIAPLVVMSIDELEDLESSTEHFGLGEFLGDYCRQGAGGVRPSLREFMDATQGKYNFILSRETARLACDKLEEAQQFLFPTPAKDDCKAG